MDDTAMDDGPRLLRIFAPEDDGDHHHQHDHHPGQDHFTCPHCRRPLTVIVEDVQVALSASHKGGPDSAA